MALPPIAKNLWIQLDMLLDYAKMRNLKSHWLNSFIVIAISYLFSIAVNMHFVLRGNFTTLPGDRFDGMIGTAVLEHWYQVFKGNASWSSPGWHFPYDRVIAHGDASFLNAVLYSPFRVFGLDPFISQYFATTLLQTIGFFSFFWFALEYCKFDLKISLLGSILFTINNAMTIHTNRYNLATFALIPLFLIINIKTLRAMREKTSKRWISWVILSSVLYGSWAITCFYVFFFMHYFFLIFTFVLVFAYRKKITATEIKKNVNGIRLRLFSWFFTLLSSLGPFVYLYFPKSQEVGVRSFSQVSKNAVNPIDFMQMGVDNFLWGNFYNKFFIPLFQNEYTASGEYYNLGISPIAFILIISLLGLLIKRKSYGKEVNLVGAVLVTILVSWFSIMRFGNFTPYIIPFYVLPGAKALNAIMLLQLVLIFPVLLLVCYKVAKSFSTRSAFLIVSLILVIGEFNRPYLNFHRTEESARIEVVKAPPVNCKSFFVSGYPDQADIPGWGEWINSTYPHNVVAMMLSVKHQIPTINGFASFNPPDWNLSYVDRETYLKNVAFYINTHNLTQVCEVNLVDGNWSQFNS
jgi:hypothetical protein